MVKGNESYDLLKNSFSDIFSTTNKIIKEGKILVDGFDIPVEIFLGGDYKVSCGKCLLTNDTLSKVKLFSPVCILLCTARLWKYKENFLHCQRF